MSDSLYLSVENVVQLVQANGVISQSFKGFEPRSQQQKMMANIVEAYNKNQITLIEAGTGTGKSLAYLIPALVWAAHHNERTVISTNTLTLQEQLVQKDIPLLLKALNLNLKAVLVKGMNNYICIRKLEDARSELKLFPSDDQEEVDKVESWRHSSEEGSKAELPFVPNASVWDRIGAENEACLHHECPHYQQCYFFKARKQAQDAHLLVVNHHLLFNDLVKRAEHNNYNETSILPVYRRLILDEAHHIEDIATEYFATRLHRLELLRLLSRLSIDKQGPAQGKLPLLKDKLHLIYKKFLPRDARDVGQIISRLTIDLPAIKFQLIDQINKTFDSFAHFMECLKNPMKTSFEETPSFLENKLRLLKEHHAHPRWKDEVTPQVIKLIEQLKQYCQVINSLEADLKLIENERLHEQTKSLRLDIQGLAFKLETTFTILDHFLSPVQSSTKVRWIEANPLRHLINIHLVDADLDISHSLVNYLFSKFSTIVLCSATLTTNQQFTFIRQRLGLTKQLLKQRLITEHIYDSPFNYRKQALLGVPTDMPPPTHADFNVIAFENVWKAIQASRGQAFVLFTSYHMLKSCYEVLKCRLEENHYPLLKQGEGNRQALLNKFKVTKQAVLFGTDSFWEGVDVAGDALRCVIIVKLPFKVPSEPLIQARAEAIAEKGGNPFLEFNIPHAIVKFKQGFGRLIRNKWDRGCIVCLDTRLVNKGYGDLFLNSLPNCEKIFMNGSHLWQKMEEFYRCTYHLTKNNSFKKL